MLDQAVFTRELLMLAERFARDISDPVLLRYYDTLKQHLTTREFEIAARYVFDHDQFWPAPMRFVEAVHGSTRESASTEWRALLAGAARGERVRLTPPGEMALIAAGGWREVAYADTDRKLPRLERAFARAYEDATARASTALPEPTSGWDIDEVPA